MREIDLEYISKVLGTAAVWISGYFIITSVNNAEEFYPFFWLFLTTFFIWEA